MMINYVNFIYLYKHKNIYIMIKLIAVIVFLLSIIFIDSRIFGIGLSIAIIGEAVLELIEKRLNKT